MMGRAKRIRSSVGSLLCVAALAASACGGTSVGEPTLGSADAGAGAGGQAADFNPPLMSGSADCPAKIPVKDAPCAPDKPLQCIYGHDACDATIAQCRDSAWQYSYYAILCGAGGAGGG